MYIRENIIIPLPRLQHTFEDDGAFYFSTALVLGISMFQLTEEQKQVVTAELLEHVATLKSLRFDTPGMPDLAPLCWQPKDDIGKGGYVFCHNDLGQHNVIVDPKTLKISVIIDWEYGGFKGGLMHPADGMPSVAHITRQKAEEEVLMFDGISSLAPPAQDDEERKARIGGLIAAVETWLIGMGRCINIPFWDSGKFSDRDDTLSGTL
ncbi:hypothetical protein N0V88_000739, partial [Collariella sp. IMI 366227]